jgi:glycosyltransferase involved in cell wall biosynthesis
MRPLISVCIPTYKRPELLSQALESCLIQGYKFLEVVVGDDSPDARSEQVVEQFQTQAPFAISYKRNIPSLGQNANVDSLFRRASGDRLVLLHDDDLLMPDAIETLAEPWEIFPDLALAFGKQEIISELGSLNMRATLKHNRTHHRTIDQQGIIADPLRAALMLQIPNDGFMVDSHVARAVGYRSDLDVGVYCDKDFALRLGAILRSERMFFVDRYVSQYRETANSISKSGDSRKRDHPRAAVAIYEGLAALGIPSSLDSEKSMLVEHLIDKLVKGYALNGQRRKALELYAGRIYGWRRRLSPRGVYHLAIITEPRFDGMRPYR